MASLLQGSNEKDRYRDCFVDLKQCLREYKLVRASVKADLGRRRSLDSRIRDPGSRCRFVSPYLIVSPRRSRRHHLERSRRGLKCVVTATPKNKGKGGKNRRRGKNENEFEKRELVFKEDGQEYAQVIKMLGNGRLEAMCFNGVKRSCHVRGKLRKKVWINTSDIILVGLRDYRDNKADIILKYNADEARSLKAYGELPEHAKINETDTFGPGDDDEIQFDDIGDDDEDIDDI
ncbi:eukaryotic translation initiation factor 1A, X-chromosomal-like [Moschus berezovskii]|uniref:eukaryotic translation initiation factor 1A, X-chromosomal-like n=1 Tax=Moschus berezovskii TaxID=68408 RepID=UPI002444B949|nr:eukaryotic translation initiation factor 1A, X-chromosomal-like [Moschus berezovskii]